MWQKPDRTAAMADAARSAKVDWVELNQWIGVMPSMSAAWRSPMAESGGSPQGSGSPNERRLIPSMSWGRMPASAMAASTDWIVSSL